MRSGVQSPCVDCSRQHQAKMLDQGLCERPDVLFLTAKGETQGLGNEEYGYVQALRATPYTRQTAIRLMQANPKRTVRQEIEMWIQKGSSNG